jgi:hypothetical protein
MAVNKIKKFTFLFGSGISNAVAKNRTTSNSSKTEHA